MRTVLVVDDTGFMRQSLRMILEQNNFQVVGEAENGEDAIRKYHALKPDLVTMDITMPVMNGIDATKSIISSDPKAKIVVISALGQEAYIKSAIISGAKNFIVKPFKAETVIRTLEAIL